MVSKLEKKEILEYTKEITKGLIELSDSDLIHSDLLPKNILIKEDNELCLIDYYQSQIEPDVGKKTVDDIKYMSPEIIKGESLNSSTDVWSLGIILYEMLIGKCPFEGGSVSKIQDKIMKGKFHKSELPAEFKDIVCKMIVLEKDDRIGLTDLLESLESIIIYYIIFIL